MNDELSYFGPTVVTNKPIQIVDLAGVEKCISVGHKFFLWVELLPKC